MVAVAVRVRVGDVSGLGVKVGESQDRSQWKGQGKAVVVE